MKITKDGIMYYLDDTKKMAIVESFQDVYFNEVHIPPMVNGFIVKHICSRAFKGSKHIQKVVLPDTITKINAEAFAECYFLEKLHFYMIQLKILQFLKAHKGSLLPFPF